MFQIIGIAIILGILIIQRFLKTRSVKTGEVVLYDTNSSKGKIYSLITRIKTLQLIILLIITVIGSVITRNYRTLKNIQAISENGQYDLAHQLIEESKNGFIPLLFSRDLNYHNNINWAISSIDNENWNEAVVTLNELIQIDSIPNTMQPKAFSAYCEYFKYVTRDIKKPFDSFSYLNFGRRRRHTREVYTYRDYLRNYNIDSLTVTNAYHLYEQNLKSTSIESIFALASETHQIEHLNALLSSNNTNLINTFLIEYSQNPVVITNSSDTICPRGPRLNTDTWLFEYSPIPPPINEKIEIKLMQLCKERNIKSFDLIYSEIDAERGISFPFNGKATSVTNIYSIWLHRKLKTCSIEEAINVIWHCDVDIKDAFIRSISPSKINSLINKCVNEQKHYSKFIDTTVAWHLATDRWWLNYPSKGLAGFDPLFNYREFLIDYAWEKIESKESSEAITVYNKLIELDKIITTSNLDLPWQHLLALDGFSTADAYRNRAYAKWKIKPYGPKMGYCDDLRKAIELGAPDDIITEYYSNCE